MKRNYLNVAFDLSEDGQPLPIYAGTTISGRLYFFNKKIRSKPLQIFFKGSEGVRKSKDYVGCAFIGRSYFRSRNLYAKNIIKGNIKADKTYQSGEFFVTPFEIVVPSNVKPSFENYFNLDGIAFVAYFLEFKYLNRSKRETINVLPTPVIHNSIPKRNVCLKKSFNRFLSIGKTVTMQIRMSQDVFSQNDTFEVAVEVSSLKSLQYIKASFQKAILLGEYESIFTLSSEKFYKEQIGVDMESIKERKNRIKIRFCVDPLCHPSFEGAFLQCKYFIKVNAKFGLFSEFVFRKPIAIVASEKFDTQKFHRIDNIMRQLSLEPVSKEDWKKEDSSAMEHCGTADYEGTQINDTYEEMRPPRVPARIYETREEMAPEYMGDSLYYQHEDCGENFANEEREAEHFTNEEREAEHFTNGGEYYQTQVTNECGEVYGVGEEVYNGGNDGFYTQKIRNRDEDYV